jgi:hypothetical protein
LVEQKNGEPFDMLGDFSNQAIQSRDVYDRMTQLGVQLRQRGLRRGATVSGPSVLARMQVSRSLDDSNIASGTFETEADALKWLRS